MIYVDYTHAEFGLGLSAGIWLPFMYRNAGHKVGFYSKYPFPEEWVKEWFDEYHFMPRRLHVINKGLSTPNLLLDKLPLEKLVIDHRAKPTIPDDAIRSMPLPPLERPMKEPYAILIPNMYDYIMIVRKSNKKTHPWKWRGGLTFENWKIVADHLRAKGYKIVVFACNNSAGKKEAKELADKLFYFKMGQVNHTNEIFVKQLAWMQNAAVNIGFGGPIHICFCFEGLRGVGYDKKIDKAYRHLLAVLKPKRPDLFLLENPELRVLRERPEMQTKDLKAMPYDFSVEINGIVKDMIIENVDLALQDVPQEAAAN